MESYSFYSCLSVHRAGGGGGEGWLPGMHHWSYDRGLALQHASLQAIGFLACITAGIGLASQHASLQEVGWVVSQHASLKGWGYFPSMHHIKGVGFLACITRIWSTNGQYTFTWNPYLFDL